MPINQSVIIDKLNKYYENHERPEYNQDGLCNGLVYLYFYKGKEYVEGLLAKIANCSDDKLDDVAIEIEKLLNHVLWLFSPGNYIPDLNQQTAFKALDVIRWGDEQPIIKEGSLSFTFNGPELIQTLVTLIKSDRLTQLSTDYHTVGVVLRNQRYYLYDPNEDEVEMEFNSISDLANQLKTSFVDGYTMDDKPDCYALSITVLRKGDQTPALSPNREINNILQGILVQRMQYKNDLMLKQTAWNGTTALHMAALAGNENLVKSILRHKVDVNSKQSDGFTPLYYAAKNGHLNIIKLLIEAGANLNATDTKLRTVLSEAAAGGHINSVKYLLSLPAVKQNINSKDINGSTALIRAIASSQAEIALKLLMDGTDPAIDDDSKRNALHFAAIMNMPEVITLILSINKALIDTRDIYGRTPLYSMILEGPYSRIAELLIKAGANTDIPESDGTSPLQMATHKNYNDIVDILLQTNTNINYRGGQQGITALQEAISKEHIEIAKKLLANGANPAIADNDGDTVLHYAVFNGIVEIIEKILRTKNLNTYINLFNNKQQTALMLAISEKANLHAASMLIKAGANLDSHWCKTEIIKLESALQTITAKNDKIQTFKKLACLYYCIGDSPKSFAAYSEILKLDNKDVDALLYSGLISYELNNISEAVKYFEFAVNVLPPSLLDLYNDGRTLAILQKQIMAIDEKLKITLANEQASIDQLNFCKARCFYALGLHRQKLDSYEYTNQLLTGKKLKSEHSHEEGECFSKALAIYNSLANGYPNEPNFRILQGDTLLKLAKYSETITAFTQAFHLCKEQNKPLAAICLMKSAQALIAANKSENALDLYELARKYDPNSASVIIEMANLHQSQKNYSRAETCYNLAINMNPHDIVPYLQGAQNARKLGKLAEALKAYEIVLQSEPDNILAKTELASHYAHGIFQPSCP